MPAAGVRENLLGRRFGRLVVTALGAAGRWLCVCDCGTRKEALASNLKRGLTASCGCLQREVAAAAQRTHGETVKGKRSPEHGARSQLQVRCFNKSRPEYKNYGGRGITIDPRWLGPRGFQNFLEDMGRRPGPEYSIDRKNNDGNYCKENCRWATRKEQNANTRSNRQLTFGGETLHVAEWARRTGLKATTIRKRLVLGWPIEQALGLTHNRW